MKFERISYSESIEAVNASGNKKWFKSSADIIEIDDVSKATQLAKEYVAETIGKSLSANTLYIPDPATFYSKTAVVSATKTDKAQQEAATIAEIFNCKDLKSLLEFEVVSKTTKTLTETYLMMFKKLNK